MSRNEGVAGPTAEGALDSWKEIASYLGRSVRTVQTWEKREGLPVHRHRHRRGGTVYAFPAEIDEWKHSRDDLGDRRPEAAAWKPRSWRPVAALAIVAVAGLVWLLTVRSTTTPTDANRPVLEFAERDRLLIAGFDNGTGEGVLDGTLEAALERDLRSHGFSSLVSSYRLGDSLQLIGQPLDARVDSELAREIARRDSEVRAVLAGRVERQGTGYLLRLDLLDPVDGVVLASLTEEAPSQREIMIAVARLSREVRQRLGAAAPAPGRRTSSLPTPSLQALQLFTKADRLFVEHALGGSLKDAEAEKLLREAIAEDPRFAAAYTHLAWAIKRQFGRADQYMPHAKTAFDLSDSASLLERYFIRGSYFQMLSETTGVRADVDEALENYLALLELDPAHFWAFENAFLMLPRLGRGQERLELALRSLNARPHDVASLSRFAQTLVAVEGDFEEARPYVERARKLRSERPVASRPVEPFLDFFPVHEAWVRGDLDRVVREVDGIVASVGSRAAAEGKPFARQAFDLYLDLGMFEKAAALQNLYTVVPPRAWRYKMGWRRGEGEVVRELGHFLVQSGQVSILATVAADLATFGYLDEAEEVLARLPAEGSLAPGLASAARGHIAYGRGQYEEARVQLEQSVDLLRYGGGLTGYYFSSVQALSRVWEALGEPQRAIEALERASADKPRMLNARVWWKETQLRLAEVYRNVGRLEEAIAIENELRRYCAYADSEFPILRELEARSRLAGTASAAAPAGG